MSVSEWIHISPADRRRALARCKSDEERRALYRIALMAAARLNAERVRS